MFTGIITDVGRVRRAEQGTSLRLEIETRYPADGIALGASICCNGACLSVVDRQAGWFAVDASAETLSRTTLGTWRTGTKVNLERALKVGDELGGHLVSGHVDGLAKLVDRASDGGGLRMTFEAPTELARSIASKGSVTIDGVSLTVNEVEGPRFGVNLVPITLRETNLGEREAGDSVNLEIDPLARYVARLIQREV